MKRSTLLGMALLAFVILTKAQDMAKEQAESISTYLSLDANQKEAVFQIYKALEDKKKQEREALSPSGKPSKEAIVAAREKAKKARETRDVPKASGKNRRIKPGMSLSERILLLSYRQAELDPSIQQKLQEVFTGSQYEKWQSIGK